DRIQVFDREGRVRAVWPGLHSVDGLCAAPDGTLYGSAGIDHALIRFDAAGRPAEVWIEPTLFTYPHAVAAGRDGSLYAAATGDVWEVTGNLPAQRRNLPRTGPEGSSVRKLRVIRPA
ncbi:MAG: hypothetical protein JNG83_03450, partial [Opitutaceae bacterium]|nr:hypothetical protein [Opitutaceae bacterium]